MNRTASWIELSRRALEVNVATFRARTPAALLGVVLKSNAYGHGLAAMLELVHPRADVAYFIDPADALLVRRLEAERGWPRRRLVVLGATSPHDVVELARADVEVVVGDAGFAPSVEALRAARLPQPLRAHVHVDTGLGREGFTPEQLETAAPQLFGAARDVLRVAGVLSHFANTEDVTEQSYAEAQLAAFERGQRALAASLGPGANLERHIAASAAALMLPASRYDAVRVGISLYGLWPSSQTRLSAKVVLGALPPLEPVLSWRAPSQVVKWLPAGSFVGYGCTYRCTEATRVAVLPVGYYDGYPRLASGKAHVLVNGQRCGVLGRVMMNHVVVDVTRAVRDEAPLTATLIGRDGGEHLPVESLAEWAQTIHYEIVARLGAHLQRVIVA